MSYINSIKTPTNKPEAKFKFATTAQKGDHLRATSVGKFGENPEKTFRNTFLDLTIKPKLLEGKLTGREEFLNLSDGFKRVFTADRKDQKMVLPISGYAGHRRGDRCQNFFGKTFREQSIQSKKLQRELQKYASKEDL